MTRHVVLTRWLTWQARNADAEGRRAAAVLSHALFDHAVPDPDEPAAADDDRALHALAALGGAAGIADLEPIADVWLGRVGRHLARIEMLRLGIEVMNRICALCRGAAEGSGVPGEFADAAFARVGAWLAQQPDVHVWRDSIEVVLDSWLVTLRLLRDRAGLGPPDLRALPWPPTVVESAIAGDAAVVAALQEPQPIFEDPFRLGYALGLLAGDPRAAAFRPPEKSPRWQQAFAAGRRLGSALLSGPDDRHAVDAGARLMDGGVADGAFQKLPTRRGEPAREGAFAHWSFLGAKPACSGTARALSLRAARQGTDEIEADSHFLCLGAAGASAVLLEFGEMDAVRHEATLVLSAQKGQRGALPYGGEAGLEILLDDRTVTTISDLGSPTAGQFLVRLGRMEVGRTRTLQIRLQAGSNTTVRLFQAWIE